MTDLHWYLNNHVADSVTHSKEMVINMTYQIIEEKSGPLQMHIKLGIILWMKVLEHL